jgi:hypothetical protein
MEAAAGDVGYSGGNPGERWVEEWPKRHPRVAGRRPIARPLRPPARRILYRATRLLRAASSSVPRVEAAFSTPSRTLALRVTTKQALLENHVLPFFGDKLLEDITVLDIERFKAAVKAGRKAEKGKTFGRELSAGQINNALTVLRRMLTWAAETGVLRSVPHIKFLRRSRRHPP